MRQYLLFRLYGPLASYGETAVGEQRPTANSPAKSAVLGLLAAALGIRRDEIDRHQAMAASLRFAVLQYASGQLLRDYHTAQVPSASALKKAPCFSRRDELSAVPRRELNTILSYRDYRVESMHAVAVWLVAPKTQETSETIVAPALADLKAALEQPRFTLYLGRKSCPLALPLDPAVESAETLQLAFVIEHERFMLKQNAMERDKLEILLPGGEAESRYKKPDQVQWLMSDIDSDEAATDADLQIQTRNDEPLNRVRWQFGPRQELRRAWIKPNSEAER